MKTHILQLEPFDDVVSARDKMGWSKAGRILLVWPEQGQVLNRRLDLLLLQRQSLALGAQLALVSRDPDVRYYAPRLGIPVFRSLNQAQSVHWRVPRRFRKGQKEETQTVPKTEAILEGRKGFPLPPASLGRSHYPVNPLPFLSRLVFFTLGVLAFLAIAATLLPSATINLDPQVRQQEIILQVVASPDNPSINLSGAVPARWVTVIVEGLETTPTSGSVVVPDQVATGYALFTNLTDRSVQVPEGSIVRTSQTPAIRFAVTQSGEVPAGPGQNLSLPIRCLTPGKAGNLPASSLAAIEGLLGTQISATNPEPTLGGTDRQIPAPNADDRRQLASQLGKMLEKTAIEELHNQLSADDSLAPSSLELVEVLDETYQPAGDQPADQLSMSLRLEFRALVVSAVDLEQLTQAVLNAQLPKGYSPLVDTLEIKNLAEPSLTESYSLQWQLIASRRIQAQVPASQAVRLTLWLTPEQAMARLAAAFALQSAPKIILSPTWWPRMPILPFRIEIW